jgi:membrane-associated phospholipid phosphatase
MCDNPSLVVSTPGHPRRTLALPLALALTLGLASSAAAATMPLHLADAPPGGFTDGSGLQRTEPEALGLGGDPGALGTADVGSLDGSPTAAQLALPGAAQPPMPSLAAFPGRVGRDFVHLVVRPFAFDAKDWTKFTLGAGVVGVVAVFDNRIRDSVQGGGNSGSTGFASRIRPIGTWGGVAAMGVALAVGELFHEPELAATGLDGIEASLLTGVIIVPAIKGITGRLRPNAGEGASEIEAFSGGQSFPSGETAVAFTNAAVIAHHTNSVVVRGIAWGLAGLVGWERMRLDAHWASDVVAGALIGSAVGSWVAKIHRPGELTGHTAVSVVPIVGPRTFGVTAAISW